MADDERRNQEDAIAPQRVLHLDVQLGHRDNLALCRYSPPDHLRDKYQLQDLLDLHRELVILSQRERPHLQLDSGGDDHALPQVSHSKHEGGAAIPLRDDGVPGEDERLGSAVGLRRLHEDAAEHHGVDNQPHNVLDDQNCDGEGTLLRHHSPTKTDGHLHEVNVCLLVKKKKNGH